MLRAGRLRGALHEARRAFLAVPDRCTLADLVQERGGLRRLLAMPAREPAPPDPAATFARAARFGRAGGGDTGMRETVLTAGDDGRKVTITTGDQGTEVLDAGGRVVGSYGTDRHDELVEKHQEEGWRVAEDGDVAPAQVAEAPPPSDDDGSGDGFRELDLGSTG